MERNLQSLIHKWAGSLCRLEEAQIRVDRGRERKTIQFSKLKRFDKREGTAECMQSEELTMTLNTST